MNKKHQAKELISKYHQGQASPEERLLLEQWFLIDLEHNDALPSVASMERAERKISTALSNHVGNGSDQGLKKLWPRVRMAAGIAAAVAAIAFGIWFFAYRELASLPHNDSAYASDVAPGKQGATLTLASGEVIQLSDAKKGVIIANGKVVYSASSLEGGTTKQSSEELASLPRNDGKGNDGMQKLTASTAKGQTYEFTLPDGTHVFLNADSKIIFPSQFSGNNRKILLEGEGYFEVAKDKAHPFIVETERQTVEVLGTHFNMSAYADDALVKTTLLEGRVRVKGGGRSESLIPGEQASSGAAVMQVKTLSDPEAEIDWKNGDFIFAQESLAEIMKKVSRWYNVEVRYAGDVDQEQSFSGKVSRKRNISQVLKALQTTQALKFRITGKKVVVSN